MKQCHYHVHESLLLLYGSVEILSETSDNIISWVKLRCAAILLRVLLPIRSFSEQFENYIWYIIGDIRYLFSIFKYFCRIKHTPCFVKKTYDLQHKNSLKSLNSEKTSTKIKQTINECGEMTYKTAKFIFLPESSQIF